METGGKGWRGPHEQTCLKMGCKGSPDNGRGVRMTPAPAFGLPLARVKSIRSALPPWDGPIAGQDDYPSSTIKSGVVSRHVPNRFHPCRMNSAGICPPNASQLHVRGHRARDAVDKTGRHRLDTGTPVAWGAHSRGGQMLSPGFSPGD